MKTPKLKKPTLNLTRSKEASGGIKTPKVVSDLYADLRDRRLLPLIALLVVAIAAVPFLLSEEERDPAPVPAPAAVAPTKASFSVVPAKEELRDYRKRLKHRKRVSPFSTYAALGLSNEDREAVEGAVETVESGEVPAETTEVPTASGGTPIETEAPAQQPPANDPVVTEVSRKAVVKVGYSDLEPIGKVLDPQTPLPKPENAVLTYIGPSEDGHGARFQMSDQVTAYFGRGKCVAGGDTCQVLELGPGKSATFAVGFGDTRYKVTFVDFLTVAHEVAIEPRRK